MSEISNPQTQNPQAEEVSHFNEVQSRASEIAEIALVSSRVALQGLKTHITESRYERAVDTMERMDHKDALYEHLGTIALGRDTGSTLDKAGNPRGDVVNKVGRNIGTSTVPSEESGVIHRDRPIPQADGSPDKIVPIKSRSLFERMADRRINKRAEKYQKAVDEEFLTRLISGGTANVGYDKRGARKQRERAARRQGKAAGLSAAEIQRNVIRSRTQIQRGESGMQSQSRKEVNKRTRRLERVSRNQPLLSRWRGQRQKNAIGTIKKTHQPNIDNHEKLKILRGEKRAFEIERELKKTPHGRLIIQDQHRNI